VHYDGAVESAVREYLAGSQSGTASLNKTHFKGHLLDEIEIRSATVNNQPLGQHALINPDQDVVIEFAGVSKVELSNFNLFSAIHSRGVRVATVYDSEPGTALPCGEFRSRVSIPSKTLRPGDYTISIGGERSGGFQWFLGRDLGKFTILEEWSEDFPARNIGIVNIPTVGARKVS
jgi:hypothetical protein